MYWNRGEIRNLWSMTKKRSSEISADENEEIFREKVKFWKFFSESENLSKIGGKIWNRGAKCIMVSGGMDAPARLCSLHPCHSRLASLCILDLPLCPFIIYCISYFGQFSRLCLVCWICFSWQFETWFAFKRDRSIRSLWYCCHCDLCNADASNNGNETLTLEAVTASLFLHLYSISITKV